MKKQLFTILTVSIGIGGVLCSTVAFADEIPNELQSNAIVKFLEDDSPSKPVDPVNPDPNKPVTPFDPTTPDNKPNAGTKGPLSIDFASSLDFGENKISTADAVYKVKPQKYMTEDKKEMVGPNYVQITDKRGTLSGWTLDVKQVTPLKNGDNILEGAQIRFTNADIVTNSAAQKPSSIKKDFILNGETGSQNVLIAKDGEGAGTFVYRFGSDEATAADSIQLFIPGQSVKHKGLYQTTLNWSLKSVPLAAF
ncbi:hypothetical protein ATZ33_08265 [Enterococcus silesiacus]|uniref:Cell surface protein n=1 Tax=Enterococcus silesiacus TaxID=332949 RepID=A0A0S3KAM2_9ENTE|nr:WxL domain-containing protein [Enterococcus silesiacus]ALS01360.1 hypothetical protein ATZ33_08265 [Enterococcus silesiacus]OJG88593.1 cell surface protein [Enterococcus silesiacus]